MMPATFDPSQPYTEEAAATPTVATATFDPTKPFTEEPAADSDPQISEYHPSIRQRISDFLSDMRRTGPVETVMGRTADEIANSPSSPDADTLHDAGLMGVFDSKKPLITLYDNPQTVSEGVHNLAAGVVNSVGSAGGFATMGMGSAPAIVQKAAGVAFGAQGVKMGYDSFKQIIGNEKLNPAQKVEAVGQLILGGLMAFGGVHAVKNGVTPAADEIPESAKPPVLDTSKPFTEEAQAAAAPAFDPDKPFSEEAPATPEEPAAVQTPEAPPEAETPPPTDQAPVGNVAPGADLNVKDDSAPVPIAETSLVPVTVADKDIKAMRQTDERPPDVLDTIADHFPSGVKFESKADFGDYINNAQGASKDLMSHTEGTPADVVLDGLHMNGDLQHIETPDDLAQAMVAAGKARINQRTAVGAQARALAEEQARTQLFESTALKPRAGSEPVPAQQLFVGDTFKLNDHPVTVSGFPVDADTGKISGVELDGAYGRQTVAPDQLVHIDKGTLSEAPTQGRIAASGTSAVRAAPTSVGYKPGDKVVYQGEVKTVTRAVPGVDFVGVGGRAVNVKHIRPATEDELKTGRVAGATPGRPPQVPQPIARTPAPITAPVKTWLGNYTGGFKKIFAPHTIDSGATTVANILRDVNGEKANQLARADEAMHEYRKEFDKTPVARNYSYDPSQRLPHNYAIIDALEGDRANLPPRYHALASYFDQAFQDRIKVIQQFAPQALQTLIKNYFRTSGTNRSAPRA